MMPFLFFFFWRNKSNIYDFYQKSNIYDALRFIFDEYDALRFKFTYILQRGETAHINNERDKKIM